MMEPEDESHKAAPSCINCLMLEAISVEKEQELVVERAHSTSLVKENEYLRACHSNEIAKKNTEIMDHRKTAERLRRLEEALGIQPVKVREFSREGEGDNHGPTYTMPFKKSGTEGGELVVMRPPIVRIPAIGQLSPKKANDACNRYQELFIKSWRDYSNWFHSNIPRPAMEHDRGAMWKFIHTAVFRACNPLPENARAVSQKPTKVLRWHEKKSKFHLEDFPGLDVIHANFNVTYITDTKEIKDHFRSLSQKRKRM